MVAVKGPREAITTPSTSGTVGQPNPNLSSAIRAGNRLFVSGMLGATDLNKGQMRNQTEEAMNRIGLTLRAAGYGWQDVVDGVVYLTDVKRFAEMNEAYRSFISKDFPARATVEVSLVNPDGMVEIMFTAVK